MHPEAFEYVAAALLTHADPRPKRVAEFGSYNVNGSVRALLTDAEEYLGIDSRDGPDVDKVIDAARWNGKGEYDLVVSTETLEHTPRPESVINSAHKALKGGGLLIATMAAPERAPHGVNGGRVGADEHYANISEEDLRGWLSEGWNILDIQHHPDRGDLYVTAKKKRERKAAKKDEGEHNAEMTTAPMRTSGMTQGNDFVELIGEIADAQPLQGGGLLSTLEGRGDE